MVAAWKEIEIACLRKLAELYEKGETTWQADAGWEVIGLTNENHRPVLNLLEYRGYIDWPWQRKAEDFTRFTICGSVLQVVREFAEQEKKDQERKDIVELVRLTLRKHPVTAWTIIIAAGLLAVVTGANQVVSLFKNLGWMD